MSSEQNPSLLPPASQLKSDSRLEDLGREANPCREVENYKPTESIGNVESGEDNHDSN